MQSNKIRNIAKEVIQFEINALKNLKNGINASSISEISTIPRATVIRKLKFLLKQKLVKKNKKLEYMLLPSAKNIKSFEENYMHNQKHKAGFVTTIFDLMKNSSFKVE